MDGIKLCGVSELATRLQDLDLRQGQGPDSDLELFGAYCALAPHLGMQTPDELNRIEWLLDQPFPAEEGLVPVMERVSTSLVDPATRVLAKLYLARCACDRNDLATSDPLFREVLRDAREVGSLVEAAACLHYARQCSNEERVFETLILARHASSIYERESRQWEWALVQADLCWARTETGNWEGGAQAAQAGFALLGALPKSLALPFSLLLRVHQVAATIGQGELEHALTQTAELEAQAGAIGQTPNKVRWFAGFRADIHSRAGRYDLGLRLIDSIRHLIENDRTSFYVELIEVRCLAHLGQVGEAVARAASLFDRLENGRELLGARGWIDQAVALAEVLEDPCRDLVGSKRAYDIAATAMVSRILELDRAVQDVPQLGFTNPSDIAVLAESRWRFTEQQERMTAAVRRMLERAARAGAEDLTPLLDPNTLGRMCAWCGKVGTPQGTWLPIAQYLPKAEPSRLTHGICPTCVASMESGMTG